MGIIVLKRSLAEEPSMAIEKFSRAVAIYFRGMNLE